ncbi:hypothetical protein EIN_178250 [Entamoeba invadens IP1]|uniref:hypothetical protein n=1 Tax=Entamoeba invadens IP1 TaxID=370355 RepID=UPI0002C3CEF4|nr:hypothetical protein EIN_178250 [Entamoeba invadens IP1]ELP93898.1 hypothetical protein EIN_178250 [Entamoeba invadens IP1]|eukprot:XP_004260669.1 hypothetical protein EIN_178250 [Entamoeba invadens IP1]
MDRKKLNNFRSRCKKARSTAMLVYHFLFAGGAITFKGAKQSNYALKVLIGKEAVFQRKVYSQQMIDEISTVFCRKMDSIIFEARNLKFNTIAINLTKLNRANQDTQMKEDAPQTLITICRNREAAFSNFLAFILIERGFVLNMAMTTMKASISSMHLYVWDSIIDPLGNVFSPKTHGDMLGRLIDDIQNCKIKGSVTLEDLLHRKETPSAFIPTDRNLYTVV